MAATVRGDLELVKRHARGPIDAELCEKIPGLKLGDLGLFLNDRVCGNPLMAAAALGHTALLDWFIENNFPLDVAQVDGFRAIDMAVAAGQLQSIQQLAKAGADLSRGPFVFGPLELAALVKNYDAAELLVQYDVEVDASIIPSMAFAISEGKQWVELFVRAGSNPNADVPFVGSLLQLAANESDPAALEAMVAAGADIEQHGSDALVEAIVSGSDNASVLLGLGVPASAKDRHGRRPLCEAIAHDRLNAVGALIDLGANMRQRDGKKRTPLMLAQSLVAAELCFEHKARVKDKDEQGNSAIHYWSWRGNVDMVSLALTKKADANQSNHVGLTPALIAQITGSSEMLRTLNKAGANPTTSDLTGLLYFERALRSDNQTSISLPNGRVVKDPLAMAWLRPRLKQIEPETWQRWFEAGLTFKQFPDAHLLAQLLPFLPLNLTKAFVDAGWDVNHPDTHGKTPLIIATANHNLAAVELLITRKADLNGQDEMGNTALHELRRFRIFTEQSEEDQALELDIARTLLQAGADPHVRNKFGLDVVETLQLISECVECPLLDLVKRYY